jgi:hypothetical protein
MITLATGKMSDAGTITGSNTFTGLGLNNLKTQPIRQPARFTNPNGFIEVDLGSLQAIDFVALMGISAFSGTAQVRMAELYANLTTTPDYDSGIQDLIVAVNFLTLNSFYHKAPNVIFARYVRIDFTTTTGSWVDIGRLYVGKAFQPEFNMDYGESQGFDDQSEKRYTKSGRLESNKKPKRRVQEFTLSFGSKDEMYGALYDIDSNIGTTGDVLFVADLADNTYLQKRSIYGTMGALNPVVNAYYNLYEKTYRIEEIIA